MLLSIIHVFVCVVLHNNSQEYWSGLPFPSPGDLPDPGIKPWSATLRADSLLTERPGVGIIPNPLRDERTGAQRGRDTCWRSPSSEGDLHSTVSQRPPGNRQEVSGRAGARVRNQGVRGTKRGPNGLSSQELPAGSERSRDLLTGGDVRQAASWGSLPGRASGDLW